MNNNAYSILYPNQEADFKTLSDVVMHDLGIDTLIKEITNLDKEQKYIKQVLSRITYDSDTTSYRTEVFEDFLNNKDMRDRMAELLDHVQFIKDFGSFKKTYDHETGIWDLLHRIDDINDYIKTVEAMRESLSNTSIKSKGLKGLKDYIEEIYNDGFFAELKKDISGIKTDANSVQSVTIGINLNERFEACGLGLVSINNKQFKKSNLISNFAEAISKKDGIQNDTEWNGDMHFHPIDPKETTSVVDLEEFGAFLAMQSTAFVAADTRASIVSVAQDDSDAGVTYYMDKIATKLMSNLAKKLREVMSKYVKISIFNIINLIPEFMYYIRLAEYIEKKRELGFCFAKASVSSSDKMKASGIYNIKLLSTVKTMEDIVTNDLDFSEDHMVYILTGANRGGKTTITQATGQLFVLAQGGIYVPAKSFEFEPVDAIFTHFPADEDKTLDLGRLGEECIRFKEIYNESTSKSLILMNETFSTTSFEEGYYIAKDSVRAILKKGVRTIYNTHMHKLGYDVEELNQDEYINGKAVSLVVKTDGSKRSFKAEIAPPEGMSYAGDIAAKYGVTYDMLTGT